jgi:outer membrane protein assembly factor BamA
MIKRILIILILFPLFTSAQEFRAGKIYIERRDVFERTDKDWFFAAPVMNAIHVKTRNYVIEDELLFSEGELITEDLILETERNLRGTGLFTWVRIELDSVYDDTYDVYVVAKDRWSTYPALLYGTGGGESNYGGRLEEFNLAGTGTYVSGEALYRTENDIGWQGGINISQRRLFRSELGLLASLTAHKYRTQQFLSIHKPYRTLRTKNAYGIYGQNTFGNDFLYSNTDTASLIPFHEKRVNFHYSHAWFHWDRIFFSVMAEWEDVERGDSIYRQAYDNSGFFLVQFSSVSQDYKVIRKVNAYYDEDMPIGGYGSATMGRIFPIGSKDGEQFYYVGAEGEQSYYNGRSYLYARVSAGSAFKGSIGKYTYQDFTGLGFVRISDDFLLAARMVQQTAWNWDAFRQLVLDNDAGLRGFEANTLTGDNRIIGNLELRAFPDVNLWIFDLSAAAFYDIGSVWNQDTEIFNTNFYNSAGLGIRFHFTKSASPSHTFRIDAAYNITDGKFGGIVFTTRQMFSAFGVHDFKLPRLFGTTIDYE